MPFSPADHERAVELVRARVAEIPGHVAAMRAAATTVAGQPWLSAQAGAAIMSRVDAGAATANGFVDTLNEILEGVAAPVLLFDYGARWIDIQGLASSAQGNLRPDQLPSRPHWKSTASERYVAAVTTQSLACGRVADTGSAVAFSLDLCAVAGLAFYIVVGAIAIQVVIALVGAVAALESLVFSWAGVLLALGEIELSAIEIGGAVFAIVTLLGAQANQLNVLRSQLVNHSTFPHDGHWPSATAESYSDATVTDGDAKWSVTN